MDSVARDIVRKCQLFKRLDDPLVDMIANISRVTTFRKETVILRPGQACPGIYCVGRGLVRVYKIAPSGKHHILHFAEAGMTFGEVAVIGGFPSPAFAEATEDSTCAVVEAQSFQRLLRSEHELSVQLVAGMAMWVRQLIGLLEDVVLRDATGRLAGYLLRLDESQRSRSVALPVLKKDLASHLNLTSETLSRTLRRLTEAGLIDMPDALEIIILNRDALGEVAEGLLPAEFE